MAPAFGIQQLKVEFGVRHHQHRTVAQMLGDRIQCVVERLRRTPALGVQQGVVDAVDCVGVGGHGDPGVDQMTAPLPRGVVGQQPRHFDDAVLVCGQAGGLGVEYQHGAAGEPVFPQQGVLALLYKSAFDQVGVGGPGCLLKPVSDPMSRGVIRPAAEEARRVGVHVAVVDEELVSAAGASKGSHDRSVSGAVGPITAEDQAPVEDDLLTWPQMHGLGPRVLGSLAHVQVVPLGRRFPGGVVGAAAPVLRERLEQLPHQGLRLAVERRHSILLLGPRYRSMSALSSGVSRAA